MRGLRSGFGEETWIAGGPLLGGLWSVAIRCFWGGKLTGGFATRLTGTSSLVTLALSHAEFSTCDVW